MLGRSRRSNAFSEIFKKSPDSNMMNIAKMLLRTLLKIANDRAGLSDVPGAHKQRDNCYGAFQTGNTWVTNKGSITNMILRRQL